MAAVCLFQEMEFCKTQIKKYSELYENLLLKYSTVVSSSVVSSTAVSSSVVSSNDAMPVKREPVCNSKQIAVVNDDDEDGGYDDCCEEDVNDDVNDDDVLISKISNYINSNIPLKSETSRESNTNENNKNILMTSLKEDADDSKRIDARKYDARAGLKEHEEKLTKIYAEERRLLAQGLDKEVVRKRVREQFYPEAIPANERKTPTIRINEYDENGRPITKNVSLLAFDEDYLDDDDPELTDTIVKRQERSSCEPLGVINAGPCDNLILSNAGSLITLSGSHEREPIVDTPVIDDLFSKIDEALADDSEEIEEIEIKCE